MCSIRALLLLPLLAHAGYLSAYVPCTESEECMSGTCEPIDEASPEGKYWCAEPTSAPTPIPTADPTEIPTNEPTFAPTSKPSSKPTPGPTFKPTHKPTTAPSKPTSEPTKAPTPEPTIKPTNQMLFGVEHLDKESAGYQEQMLPAIRAGHFFHTPSPTPDPMAPKHAKVSVSSANAMIDLNATVAAVIESNEEVPAASESIPLTKIMLGLGVLCGIMVVAQAVRKNKESETRLVLGTDTKTGATTSNEIAVITPNTDMHIL